MSAGVYCLEHVPTGRFYIGSSMRLERRRVSWMRFLYAWCAVAPADCRKCDQPAMCRARLGTVASDWRWFVIEDWGVAPRELDVRFAERRHIARAVRSAPGLCLNTIGAWRGRVA